MLTITESINCKLFNVSPRKMCLGRYFVITNDGFLMTLKTTDQFYSEITIFWKNDDWEYVKTTQNIKADTKPHKAGINIF